MFETILFVAACAVVGWAAQAFLLRVLLGDAPSRRRNARTEQGYVIRRKDNGYTMTVGADALDRAMDTDEYSYIGPATHTSLRYTGADDSGGSFDGTIPAGHVLAGRTYKDERLNR